MRQDVFDYIKKKYKTEPEYPWKKYDDNAVFRHNDNNKWFALAMCAQRCRLGLIGEDYVDVVNLKMDDMFFRDMLIQEDGIMPAYHMNKTHWISIIICSSVPAEDVKKLVLLSYKSVVKEKIK